MYVCSCFGVTEQQVRQHAATGACTPRQIASACKAGTDCGNCVRRIQALLGRGACPRRELIENGADPLASERASSGRSPTDGLSPADAEEDAVGPAAFPEAA
ncbi:(2Fe-2S)-binding protein [Streptomyces sp. NRRL S-337]|uniref:(2Fe-2S)-binding protein n=1 Tax=Streptomyces sp. NRRL S-337 TaxID=1463900 RepID=UPI0004C9F49F|nr:(2Fe-2S)-binding protein [Streptomyces sp. NRRL S-337]